MSTDPTDDEVVRRWLLSLFDHQDTEASNPAERDLAGVGNPTPTDQFVDFAGSIFGDPIPDPEPGDPT